MKITLITQARTGSTRLYGKVLKTIGGKTLLATHLERLKKSQRVDRFIVATTVCEADIKIAEVAQQQNWEYYRGSEDDVLDRFIQALQGETPDYVVRVTSDCPLVDARLMDEIIDYAIETNVDYCSNSIAGTYPDGTDVEVVKYPALREAWENATLPSEREHVTPYVSKHSDMKGGSRFRANQFPYQTDFGDIRFTVDEPSDFELVTKLIEALGDDKGWMDYVKYINANADIKAINSAIVRNEGYQLSLQKDQDKGATNGR